MLSPREWRTAGTIQSMRAGAVPQEQWLKDGNSAYASAVPWLLQDGCGWQDMRYSLSAQSRVSREQSDSLLYLSIIFVPPLPTFPICLVLFSVWGLARAEGSAQRGQSNNKTRTWLWESHEEPGKAAESLHGITQWFPLYKPSDS